jgi:hypothetical protein
LLSRDIDPVASVAPKVQRLEIVAATTTLDFDGEPIQSHYSDDESSSGTRGVHDV